MVNSRVKAASLCLGFVFFISACGNQRSLSTSQGANQELLPPLNPSPQVPEFNQEDSPEEQVTQSQSPSDPGLSATEVQVLFENLFAVEDSAIDDAIAGLTALVTGNRADINALKNEVAATTNSLASLGGGECRWVRDASGCGKSRVTVSCSAGEYVQRVQTVQVCQISNSTYKTKTDLYCCKFR